jgi:hypothetical protein
VRGRLLASTACGPSYGHVHFFPLDADVLIRTSRKHRLIRTVRSGRDGVWRARLASGRYFIEPGPRHAGIGRALSSGVYVNVRRGVFARVDFYYDNDNGCL